VELRDCPICDNDRLEELERPSTWIGEHVFAPIRDDLGLHRCTDCSFVFVNPRPGAELLQRFYSGQHYECHQHVQPGNSEYQQFDHVLDKLVDLVGDKQPRTLLDYGCGGGRFVARARQRGWDAVGFDIGEKAKEVCRHNGVPFVERTDGLAGRHLDIITLNHVLEHIDDLSSFFSTLDRLADAETLVFMEVPNAKSLRARMAHPTLAKRRKVDERFRAYPIHLSYFSMGPMERLLSKHGYEIVRRYNYGVGLDELLLRPGAATEVRSAPRKARKASARIGLTGTITRSAKQAIKRTLWRFELGENLAVAARRRQAQ
jgi:SAM-dependent methyltransferase